MGDTAIVPIEPIGAKADDWNRPRAVKPPRAVDAVAPTEVHSSSHAEDGWS
jgi:hypothetical protein